jgi:hypothetical protein
MGVATPSNKVNFVEMAKNVAETKGLKRSRSVEFKTVYIGEIVIPKPTSKISEAPNFI